MTSLQQGELWELSRRLINFNTVSALSNLEAAEYLASYLEESGLRVKVARDEIEGVTKASVIAWAGPAVEGGLIISGHIDVVPFDEVGDVVRVRAARMDGVGIHAGRDGLQVREVLHLFDPDDVG